MDIVGDVYSISKATDLSYKNDELGKIVSLASVIKYGISRRNNLYFMNLAVLLCEIPNVVVILFST